MMLFIIDVIFVALSAFVVSGPPEIIDDLAQLVDKTDSRIKNETHRVKLLDTKSASCGMLVVIVLLLIAIIVVAAWQN